MKRIISLVLLIIALVSISSCSLFTSLSDLELLSRKLNNLDVTSGEILRFNDTHGGFLGDGECYAEVKFSDNSVSEIIKNEWQKLPLTDNLNTVIYGGEVKTEFGPGTVLSFVDDKIPKIKNGYYYFEDRHSESKNKKDDTDIFNRYSYNFTVAIYDLDTHSLYFYALDT